MLKLGQGAMLQLVWLYERYNVSNAGGGMTKCTADHFGRDAGKDKTHLLGDLIQVSDLKMPEESQK